MNPKIRKLMIAALAVLTLAGVAFTTTIKPASEQSAAGNPISQEAAADQTDTSDEEEDGSDDALGQEADSKETDAQTDKTGVADGKVGKDTNSDSGTAGAAASSSLAEQTGSGRKDKSSSTSANSSGQSSSTAGSSSGQSSSTAANSSGQSDSASGSSSKQETISCTITIDCSLLTDESVLQRTGNENKQRYVPFDGIIASGRSVKVKKGSSVYDVLKSFCKAQDIRMESSYTPGLETYYVEGIHHLYEFDGGEGSGWVYFVNGQSPNYGACDVEVKEGDSIVWMYTLDYGNDVTP